MKIYLLNGCGTLVSVSITIDTWILLDTRNLSSNGFYNPNYHFKEHKAQIENTLKLKPNNIIYYSYLFFHSSK